MGRTWEKHPGPPQMAAVSQATQENYCGDWPARLEASGYKPRCGIGRRGASKLAAQNARTSRHIQIAATPYAMFHSTSRATVQNCTQDKQVDQKTGLQQASLEASAGKACKLLFEPPF